MNKHYTSIEQSKRLLELGLNPKTADMCYMYTKFDGESEPQYFASLSKAKTNDIPCWSVGALLELMPGDIKSAKDDFILNIGGEDKFHHVAYDFQGIEESFQYFQGTLLEAAYNMIVWLLENNYIEKGE